MLPAQALEISLRDLNELEFYLQVKKHLRECLELQFQFYEEKHLDSKQTLDILYMLFTFKGKLCDLNKECGLTHLI